MTEQQTQTHILHPLELDRSYEYEVQRHGDLYVAGARNTEVRLGYIFGSIFLDKVVERESEVWSPCLRNPFRNEKVKRNIRENQFEVYSILAHADFKFFIDKLNDQLKQKYRMFMDNQNLEAFFRQLYEHYEAFRRLKDQELKEGGSQ